jgi:TorA maturation chaperone TorD
MMLEAAEAIGCEAVQAPLRRLGDSLHVLAQEEMPEVLLALEAEYNRLFVGPMPPLAHPYESVYRSAGGLVMGDCTLDVLKTYAEEGFALSAGHRDLPDHLAVELEFMALLCEREARACAEGGTASVQTFQHKERSFLEAHLRCWLPQFCQRVLRAGPSPFYSRWVRVLECFIQEDIRRIQMNRETDR